MPHCCTFDYFYFHAICFISSPGPDDLKACFNFLDTSLRYQNTLSVACCLCMQGESLGLSLSFNAVIFFHFICWSHPTCIWLVEIFMLFKEIGGDHIFFPTVCFKRCLWGRKLKKDNEWWRRHRFRQGYHYCSNNEWNLECCIPKCLTAKPCRLHCISRFQIDVCHQAVTASPQISWYGSTISTIFTLCLS